MILFFTIVVGAILLAVLFRRVTDLERKVKEFSEGTVRSKPVVREQTQAAPMAATPTPVPRAPIPGVPVPPRPVQTMAESAPHFAPKAPVTEDGATEFAVGSKVLTGVGVLALILGVSFFLRYAFANNLISEGARILLGLVFGVLVVCIGHFLRKKYASYGHSLIGAGFGILYLTIYAAHSFYGLIALMPAFMFLVIVTALGVGLALYYNSKPLVVYAFLGAFIIPLILPLSSSVHTLFTYLLILNIGVLLVARFKVWPEFTIASLLGTSFLFLQWVYGPYTEGLFNATLTYITIIFFIYFITSLLNFVYRDRDYKGIDGFLVYGTPSAYFVLMLTIVHGRQEVALLAFLIGLFYLLLSFMVRAGFGHMGELKRFSNAMICVASPFIAAATALHFQGSTTTILWVIEATLMILIGYVLATSSNRIVGLILAVLAGIRTLTTTIDYNVHAEIVFNSRSMTYIFAIISFFIIWKLYESFIAKMEGVNGDEVKAGRFIGALGFFSLTFMWVTLESHDFVKDYTLYLPLIWMILSAVMISLGAYAKEKTLRVLSYIVILCAGFITLGYLGGLSPEHAILFNIRSLTVLVAVGLTTYILWLFKIHPEAFSVEERKLSPIILSLTNLLVLWAGSIEIVTYFNNRVATSNDLSSVENVKRVTLSGFWLIYALCGLATGIVRKSIFARYASMILFAVTIFKIFLYDTANLSDIYRFISFISLGVILLIAGFAYYRFKHRIMEFVGVGDKPVA